MAQAFPVVDSPQAKAKAELDSLEAKTQEFYHACLLDVDSLFLDYRKYLDPQLLNSDTELKIQEMEKILEGKPWIHAQIVRAESAENLFFILLYHPLSLEDFGRIRIIYRNDGDQLIDAWDFSET